MPSSDKMPEHGSVLDIGGSNMDDSVLTRLRKALLGKIIQGIGGKSPRLMDPLPDEILYDDDGLQIWADIIFTPEFYQTQDEINLLKNNSHEIAAHIQPGTTMIDLGAGDMRKVGYLLAEVEKRQQPSTYLALDISSASLHDNIAMLAKDHTIVKCAGLWGDFKHGLKWCDTIPTPRLFLSLGSVLFNDKWHHAIHQLREWARLMRPGDLILAGMDGHVFPPHKEKVWAAYHSHDDLFERFWHNGFEHANRLLGEDWLLPEDWDIDAELDHQEVRHRFLFTARKDIKLGTSGRVIEKGVQMDWFDAHKYGEDQVRLMCSQAGLDLLKVWQAPNSEMRQYLLKLKDGVDRSPDEIDSAISGCKDDL